MDAYYLDTCALVKRYANEPGTAWVTALVGAAAGHLLYTVRIAGPEMIAASMRKVRTGEATAEDAAMAAQLFRIDWQRDYTILEVTEAVATRAMALAETHGLRGYDAVHLAAALEVQDARQALSLSAVTFVSADDNQRRVAAAVGLPVENPNSYP